MTDYLRCNRLRVTTALHQFIEQQVLPGTLIDRETFWEGLDDLLQELAPLHRDLLAERERVQLALSEWHKAHCPPEPDAWRSFLEQLGYPQACSQPVRISTASVDMEISDQSGPQLLAAGHDAQAVVNAASARWGSLYDALYYSDAVAQQQGYELDAEYNPQRGAKVVVQVREWFDQVIPLSSGSHVNARHYRVRHAQLSVTLANGEETGLQRPEQFLGHQGQALQPNALLFGHHRLHVDVRIDPQSRAGGCDVAGISDVLLEAALTAWIDISTALRTRELDGYANWLSLMKGQALQPDQTWQGAAGGELKLPGRALLLLHINGLARHNPALLDAHGQPVAQLILDAVLGSLIALHDLQRRGNSRSGSIYLSVPGLEGVQEVAFVDLLFGRIETLLGLAAQTLKLGLTDEHWRTSLNLEACIHAAAARTALLHSGAVDWRNALATTPWQRLAERRTVPAALACGLRGRAQIGKGLWSQPEHMAALLEAGIEPLQQGASGMLVCTPIAATLHALHHHQVDVAEVQRAIEQDNLQQHCASLLDECCSQPIA
ncbi:malate synthase G [Pseudomonas sp. 21LCFQ010]|uniref:malate synthase G n=1 Tax=Pseudomonas sp. 21LCFQ010 TaxID=2957506 RepID=UPI002097057F|nr:malate synthase G [Pseudomonas sp. 21LCFQ010]MCO8165115.1 malate synthase G [Pseudomonas sp. 21LCFQ010]